MVESLEHKFPKHHPLRALFLADHDGKHGSGDQSAAASRRAHVFRVARSGDIAKAKALSNPQLAPHLDFVDMGGHGYSVVRASARSFDVEFVCIPRPIERSATDDGGPLRYRVVHARHCGHQAKSRRLERKVIEGNVDLMT